MRIVVTVRVRNEFENLRKFVDCYQGWADAVIILDDNSEDWYYLFDISTEHENVYWRSFQGERVARNGVSRAAHGKQINQLIDLAETLGKADWIIHDDCDCLPNWMLKRDAREIIENCERDFIYAVRLYLYKDVGYFPELSQTEHMEWTPSIWAWRANEGFRFSEDDPLVHTFQEPPLDNIHNVLLPHCLFHSPWPDDETIERKRKFYCALYDRKEYDPLEFGGKLSPIDPCLLEPEEGEYD